MNSKLNRRKCKICKREFQKERPLQMCCGYECSIKYVNKLNEIKWKREKKEMKEKIKTRSDHLKDLQKIFNKWIRLSKDQACISCGTDLRGRKFDAGHYRSVGNTPSLRFEPDNVFPQCVYCNQYLSGNPIEYRIRLVKKIGIDRVEWLEGEHEPKKYTIEEIKKLQRLYKEMIKKLENKK